MRTATEARAQEQLAKLACEAIVGSKPSNKAAADQAMALILKMVGPDEDGLEYWRGALLPAADWDLPTSPLELQKLENEALAVR